MSSINQSELDVRDLLLAGAIFAAVSGLGPVRHPPRANLIALSATAAAITGVVARAATQTGHEREDHQGYAAHIARDVFFWAWPRKRADKWERNSFIAEPRSVYLLHGTSRTEWEHSIPESLRYSVTFRSLRG